MEIQFINNHTTGNVEAHEVGCSHSNRKRSFVEVAGTGNYETRADAFFDYNGDFYEEGGKDSCYHIEFKPCTKNLPNGEWPEEF